MKREIATIAALALLSSPVPQACAKPYKHHHAKGHSSAYSSGRFDYYRHGGPYEYNSNSLPIGSPEWWRQMLRENRVRN